MKYCDFAVVDNIPSKNALLIKFGYFMRKCYAAIEL